MFGYFKKKIKLFVLSVYLLPVSKGVLREQIKIRLRKSVKFPNLSKTDEEMVLDEIFNVFAEEVLKSYVTITETKE